MIYSLFSDDIRQLCFPLSADLGFSIVTLICMIFYGLEIVVYSLVQVFLVLVRKIISSNTIFGLT